MTRERKLSKAWGPHKRGAVLALDAGREAALEAGGYLEPVAVHPELTDIPGVGPAIASKLEAAGITVESLMADTTGTQLLESGVPSAVVAKISDWVVSQAEGGEGDSGPTNRGPRNQGADTDEGETSG